MTRSLVWNPPGTSRTGWAIVDACGPDGLSGETTWLVLHGSFVPETKMRRVDSVNPYHLEKGSSVISYSRGTGGEKKENVPFSGYLQKKL